MIDWLRFIIGGILLLLGLFIFIVEMIGVFRFKYVMNRMHAAAMGDTLGISASMIGLIIMNGFNFASVKLFLVVVFLWIASPTASHMIANLEVNTNEDEEKEYRRVSLKALEEELSKRKEEKE